MSSNDHFDHIPAGWRNLLQSLIDDLQAIDPALNIVRVKEKFGRLRVQLAQIDDRALSIIRAAEHRSLETCQFCGAAGTLMIQRGVYATVCPDHAAGHRKPKRPPLASSARKPRTRE